MNDGLAVQLAHDEKETTWENHGYVRVKGGSGQTLAESDDFQHNKTLRRRRETGEDPSKSILSMVQESLSAEGKPQAEEAAASTEEGSAEEGNTEEGTTEELSATEEFAPPG